MPIYEFICKNCKGRLSFLVRDLSSAFAPKCSLCGNTDLMRAVSSFACHKSLGTVWEESGEPGVNSDDDFYTDPRNIGRWTEKKFRDMGQEVPPPIQEQIRAAREGALPAPLKDLDSVSPSAAYD